MQKSQISNLIRILKSYLSILKNLNKSDVFLIGLFIISFIQFFFSRYTPSLDAPQHLHAINNLVEIIKGNSLISDYFEINKVIVGYWMPHFIIGLFHLFLPSWMAEKIYLIIYIFGMVYSFRYLIKSIDPENKSLVWLVIFSFIFSSYQLLGYYAFSFAAIFYFTGLGYWFRYLNNFNAKRILTFIVILILLFLSHGFVFAFWCLSIGIIFIGQNIKEFLNKSYIQIFRKLLILIISVLPAFIMFIYYIKNVMGINNVVQDYYLSFKDQLFEFFRLRILVGYNHSVEARTYIPIFITLALLTIYAFILFIKNKEKNITDKLTQNKNLFVYVSIIFLILYFFAPNRISAGSLTNRFGLFFFFNLIIWLSLNKYPNKVQYFLVFIVFISMLHTRILNISVYHNQKNQIAELKELEQYIEPGSVVCHYVKSENWFHPHFGLYVGTDLPLINVKIPQCSGQFPLVWKKDIPSIFLAENNISPNAHSSEHVYDSIRFVDYIIIFYDKQFWNSKEDAENQVRIKCFFEHAYTSSNKLVSLYRFKVPDEIKSLKNTDGISKSNINSRTMNQHKLQLMSAYLERFKENPNILKN